ncbi:hypothetical protein [Limobrevibacterium gyesilva]|uniref:Uncharacterized protein n=1 Tax=Limobrevibacterium gyesilva TaxID=2991712 RepID=A0AA41YMD6_9PROT|nr:hypothetical protein [Limobrevibacterium gyesilva]MCW3474982.1 hypothetical protein [Limobrevibacterium gyesilva]
MAKGQKRSGREPKKPKAKKISTGPAGTTAPFLPEKKPSPKPAGK